MNYLGRVIGNLKGLYSGINGATLTGAIDVIVVEQEDGTFSSSPFHVRFGKLGVLRSREKVVDIEINGVPAPIRMKLGDSGEAFFVQEMYDYELDDENLATSPLPASPQLSDSDNSRKKLGETEESADDNRTDVTGRDVVINIGESDIKRIEDASNNVKTEVPPVISKTSTDDSKNRKRRKKRKRNQGSKSNIVVDPTYSPENEPLETQEGIFAMDEELTGALNALDIGTSNQSFLNQSRGYHRDFYSDTELEAAVTPQNSRPSTPIQSDSEYEISKVPKKPGEDEEVGKWPWGELPSTGNTTPATTPMVPAQNVGPNPKPSNVDDNLVSSDDEMPSSGRQNPNKSLMGGIFSFMTKRQPSGTGNTTVDVSTSGIYLDDLNLESMDPEVAALYFPNFGRDIIKDYSSKRGDQDEDVESGKGSSLPQSPAPGSSPKSSNMTSYMEEQQQKHNNSNTSSSSSMSPGSPQSQPQGDSPKFEAISICGSSLGLFEQSQLTFDELVENPDLILNTPAEAIVVKVDGKLIPWSAALPQLLSTTFFKRPLPPQLHQRLIGQYVPKKDETDSGPSISRSNSSGSKDAGVKKGYSWFPWRRSTISTEEGSSELSHELPSQMDSTSSSSPPSSPETITKLQTTAGQEEKVVSSTINNSNSGSAKPLLSKESSSSSDESGGDGQPDETTSIKVSRGSRGPSVQPSPAHTKPIPPPLKTSTSINIDNAQNSQSMYGATEKYKKSLRLTSDQIVALGLRYGQNEAVFSVTTAYQGTTVARCHIYLWRFDDRVVVSDIDGTITKSDVLGHILPIIGNDWAQSGVAQLFTQIQDNGYKMLYLSARAIGQAAITRDYLRSIRQDDVTLPDGPLLLNPTSLMSALHREVIEKKPEEFKIACLRDIQTLFPTNPFYAGYGNKINDVWAYRAVEISIPRIFTINHKGELRHALTNTFQSSYTSLVELAEYIFPAYKIRISTTENKEEKAVHTFNTTDGFSSFEFWREPMPEFESLIHNNNNNSSITSSTAAITAS